MNATALTALCALSNYQRQHVLAPSRAQVRRYPFHLPFTDGSPSAGICASGTRLRVCVHVCARGAGPFTVPRSLHGYAALLPISNSTEEGGGRESVSSFSVSVLKGLHLRSFVDNPRCSSALSYSLPFQRSLRPFTVGITKARMALDSIWA
jgi:hypothetical protein